MNHSNESSEQENTGSQSLQASGEEKTIKNASDASQSLQASGEENVSETSFADSAESVPSDGVRSNSDISSAGSGVYANESSPESTVNTAPRVLLRGPGKGKGLMVADEHGRVLQVDPNFQFSEALPGGNAESNTEEEVDPEFVDNLFVKSPPEQIMGEWNAPGTNAHKAGEDSQQRKSKNSPVAQSTENSKKEKVEDQPEEDFVANLISKTKECQTSFDEIFNMMLQKKDDGDNDDTASGKI